MVLPLVIWHSSTLWIATAVCAWAMSVLGQNLETLSKHSVSDIQPAADLGQRPVSGIQAN